MSSLGSTLTSLQHTFGAGIVLLSCCGNLQQYLLDKGVDPLLRGKDGSALDVARQHSENPELARVIEGTLFCELNT
jgi:hypothetical protein